MTDETARALGEMWQDDYPWTFLTKLTELENRMGGHPGEERAAELVVEAFERAGARNAHTEAFDMNCWTRGSAELAVTDPIERSFETIALPYSLAGDVQGELVDVGHGMPEEIDAVDVAGKIAVASTTTPDGSRFIHRMEKFGHAAAAGAEAFIFHNHVPGQLPPTGSLTFGDEAALPAVGVSKETGAWLTEYAETGATARLVVDATTEPGTSHNAVAELGPETDEEVVVVAHLDSHDIAEGALDNGCGITTVVAAAHVLAKMDLDTRVRVVGVGCEEIGLLGAQALVESLDTERTKAVVNVDGAGRFRDMLAYMHGSETMRSVIETVSDDANQPISIQEGVHPFSDHWPFLKAGVPALQLHSEADVSAPGLRGRGWGHTHADTRDKVDDRNLREHAMLAALLIREVASRGEIPRPVPDEIVENLREQEYEEGMRAAGIWPDGWN
ncbi:MULTISPECIES: M28 family metallopeptidase [unclassified Haladaptatus]|uniref:M28 family peptidase n=1 Tax=unclassified Haladaptatus TaxID=2622732 RepID=UPI00209C2C8A|nr:MULTISPECIES: M28 family metallopeptidase [unclassified Haladaptatus]MCO8242933.1 M28 family metallopeptidase [Haladaptatus sp. AB643]MCO8252689.1 M28 family metallopeptidase [Haladaptatus sp. AB618]